MDTITKGKRVGALLNDDVFKGLIKEVKKDQIDVFLDPAATLDKISEARLKVLAIDELLARMQSALTDAQLVERKNNKRN